jgi:hypothetical protein
MRTQGRGREIDGGEQKRIDAIRAMPARLHGSR